jgi:hypothetical protein
MATAVIATAVMATAVMAAVTRVCGDEGRAMRFVQLL